MTFTGAHGDIPLGFAHIAYNWEYADETAREAATGFADEDIGKFARQLDNNSMWMLVDTYPVTVWEPLGNPAAILKDGSVAMEGDLNLGSNKITNLANPSSAQDAVTKTYADGLAANLGKRARVRAATTANVTIATALNNGDTLDGVSLVTGDWVLVKNQTAAEENGIYEVGVSPARVSEFDTFNEHPGSLIAVQEGTTNADTVWLCTSNTGGVLETNDIDFSPLGTGSSAVEDLTTSETDTSLVLAPDGAGGVEWVAPGGGGAPAQVDADDISGCVLWYDLDQEAGAEDDAVGTLSDFSASNNDATQGTAGDKPILRLNAANGRKGLHFDGVSDHMDLGANLDLATTHTVLIVAAAFKRTSTYAAILKYKQQGIFMPVADTPYWGLYRGGQVNGAMLSAGPQLVGVWGSSNSDWYFINGKLIFKSSYTSAFDAGSASAIGADPSNVQFFAGILFEIRVYNVKIARADLLASVKWLHYKWGIPDFA